MNTSIFHCKLNMLCKAFIACYITSISATSRTENESTYGGFSMQLPAFCAFVAEVREGPTHTPHSIATVPSQRVTLEQMLLSTPFNFVLAYVICVSLQRWTVLFLVFFGKCIINNFAWKLLNSLCGRPVLVNQFWEKSPKWEQWRGGQGILA